jgi:hypothetical protein
VRVRAIKLRWLIAAFLCGMALAMAAEDLILTEHENRLEISAPRLHFLTGRPLERLHNTESVPFLFRLTLWSGNRSNVVREVGARFVVSWDLFEQTFKVNELAPASKSASHLTDAAAETWCLQQMSMDVSGLSGSEPLWARLEIRAQDAKESGSLFGRGDISDSGISLDPLIDVFSRRAQTAQRPLSAEAGPVTLDQLRRNPGR